MGTRGRSQADRSAQPDHAQAGHRGSGATDERLHWLARRLCDASLNTRAQEGETANGRGRIEHAAGPWATQQQWRREASVGQVGWGAGGPFLCSTTEAWRGTAWQG